MSENKKFNLGAFTRVVKIGYQYRIIFYLSLGISLLAASFSGFRPYLVGDILDEYIVKKDLQGLNKEVLILLGILIFEVIFQLSLIFLASLMSQKVIKKIRDDLFGKLLNFKLSFFDKTPNGVLVTRSVSDIETIAQIFSDGIIVIFGDMVRIILVVFFMYNKNWKLASIVIVVMPLMIIVTRFFQRALKKVFMTERSMVSKLNSFVQERISGMYIIQLFNREEIEYNAFKAINEELKQAYVKTIFYFSLLFPIVELVSSLALGLVIWYGGLNAVSSASVSPGDIVSFILFINILVRPMRQIAERFNALQRGLVSAERVFDLYDSNQSLVDEGTYTAQKITGDVSFKDVKFSYNEKEEVLKGISFDIQKGETIAIVGSTGAGKSTIVNLLGRFYDINAGEIQLDGKNIVDYQLENLRSHMAVVLQDVFLFNDTILNNITLGNPEITLEQVQKAAQEIEIHDFISSLDGGYDYFVKERGATLSVGQRQLISFLRAYVFNPSILILDEATSSIDTESEELIQKSTLKLTQGRTSIVIAHRLATIQNADKILVMEKGEIVEQGTHHELLEKQGLYHKLHEIQFSKSN